MGIVNIRLCRYYNKLLNEQYKKSGKANCLGAATAYILRLDKIPDLEGDGWCGSCQLQRLYDLLDGLGFTCIEFYVKQPSSHRRILVPVSSEYIVICDCIERRHAVVVRDGDIVYNPDGYDGMLWPYKGILIIPKDITTVRKGKEKK